MKRSETSFLTTHTGSLPRPDDLIRIMFAKEEDVPVDQAALAGRIRSAVAAVVRKQTEAGLDVISDGEVSKPSYATYVKDRLHGFGGDSQALQYQDLMDFPELARRVFSDPGRSRRRTPACDGPISVRDARAAQTDVENLQAALAAVPAEEAFLSAASPGVIPPRLRRRRGASLTAPLPSSSATTTIRPMRPICSPSPTPCGTSMKPWHERASCYKWTARTWPWDGISSSPA